MSVKSAGASVTPTRAHFNLTPSFFPDSRREQNRVK